MLNEYDVVRSVRPLSENVPAGAVGTVLIVHDHPAIAYVVEFTDDDGRTLGILTVTDEDVEIV